MSVITVGAAQLGPIARAECRAAVVKRLVDRLRDAKARACDELIVARCDLGLCRSYKTTVFDFARHRRAEHYRPIVERAGAVPPP